jgi:hypothetical protein
MDMRKGQFGPIPLKLIVAVTASVEIFKPRTPHSARHHHSESPDFKCHFKRNCNALYNKPNSCWLLDTSYELLPLYIFVDTCAFESGKSPVCEFVEPPVPVCLLVCVLWLQVKQKSKSIFTIPKIGHGHKSAGQVEGQEEGANRYRRMGREEEEGNLSQLYPRGHKPPGRG